MTRREDAFDAVSGPASRRRASTEAGSELGTVLGIWAHPDDEAYLSAGLMASARDAGQRVVVVTATAGELGTNDPDTWPPHRLAPQRRRELARSLAAVGVEEHHWLGYADGALPSVQVDSAVARVAALMTAVQPDTIVTFGPDGMTGHDDHRVVSDWVTRAWCLTGRRGRLWYATLTRDFHDRWGHLNDAVGLWEQQPSPPAAERSELAWVVTCDDDLQERKMAALRAHATQTAPLELLVGAEAYRAWWSEESFVTATACA